MGGFSTYSPRGLSTMSVASAAASSRPPANMSAFAGFAPRKASYTVPNVSVWSSMGITTIMLMIPMYTL